MVIIPNSKTQNILENDIQIWQKVYVSLAGVTFDHFGPAFHEAFSSF